MSESTNNHFSITASKQSHSIIKELCADPISRGPKNVHYLEIVGPIILSKLCAGESLQQICADTEMPSIRTVNRWIADSLDFATAVRNARQIGAQALMEAAVNIASGGVHSTGSIERDKLLCSVLKWIVSKRDPDICRFGSEQRVITIELPGNDAQW